MTHQTARVRINNGNKFRRQRRCNVLAGVTSTV